MNIADIAAYTSRPPVYEPGNAVMWTDEYISNELLQVHLNPDIDLASRIPASINATLDWMHSVAGNGPHRILDLGCGPGLYTERLARKGHQVTGLDFSRCSIEFARESAQRQSLPIEYVQGDYLQTDLGDAKFDLVTMIYTDFCVLNPEARDTLLRKVRRALVPGGRFIFDVLNGNDPLNRAESKTWDAQRGGFWRPHPHIALSTTWYYEAEHLLLNQHIVIDDATSPAVYRFWSRFYSEEGITRILEAKGYIEVSCYNDILAGDGPWSGENVTFCVSKRG